MKHILLVGQTFSGFEEAILKMGYKFTILKDIKNKKLPEDDQKSVFWCDFSNIDKVIAKAKEINENNRIDGSVTAYERYIEATAQINQSLQIPGLSPESAKLCTDKSLMRKAFLDYSDKISPNFSTIKTFENAKKFAEKYGFPLILKPANLAKSLLVLKCENMSELITNFEKIKNSINEVYQKYAPNNEQKIIIEEFLEGPIFSVDAFIDTHGNVEVLESVVDYRTGYDMGFDDNFHYSRTLPSKLSSNQVESIRQVAKLGCQALKMKASAAHVEVILTKKGPKIVEIGARNGGYRDRMHNLSNGIELSKNLIRTILGEEINITPTRHDHCATIELFPKEFGFFDAVRNLERLKKLPSLKYLRIIPHPNDKIGKAGDGFKASAIIILHNSDVEIFKKDLRFVENEVEITTKKEDAL